MTTPEAIQYAKENKGQHVRLLSLNDTYIYTNDGTDFNLIIKGAFSLGFAEMHDEYIDKDLAFYTNSLNWLRMFLHLMQEQLLLTVELRINLIML